MKKTFRLILIIISIIPYQHLPAQLSDGVKSENVMAVYIYNFTKFLEWEKNDSGFFSIIVLGKSKVTDPLFKIADNEKVNGKAIVVNEISDLYSLDFCNILYLPPVNNDLFYDTLKKIKGKKVLLVTNSNGFAEKGAGINFVQVGDKMKFEINRRALEEAGIIPNTRLLSLAVKVYE